MSEFVDDQEPLPRDPDLSPCQIEMRQLCEEVLGLIEPRSDEAEWDVRTTLDPAMVQETLRNSSLGDLMLQDNDALLPQPNRGWANHDALIGESVIEYAKVGALVLEFNKRRFNPESLGKSASDVVYYPGEIDWQYQLEMLFCYKNNAQTMFHKIGMETSSTLAGKLPLLYSHSRALSYMGREYNGHNKRARPAKDNDEATFFISIARKMFESRAT